MNKDKVVIVGGGPVGLWTSILIKLQSPKAEVVILEKYEKYSRNHLLRLDSKILDVNIKDKKAKNEIANLIKNINEKAKKKSGTLSIKTIELEKELATLALKLGIKKEICNKDNNKEITSLASIPIKHQNAKFIIGADGAKSVIRSDIAKIIDNKKPENAFSYKKNLQHMIEIRGYTKKPLKSFDKFSEYLTLKLLNNHFIHETLSSTPNKKGEYPFSLRFLVNKKTFNDLKVFDSETNKIIDPNLKNPIKLGELIKNYIDEYKESKELSGCFENPEASLQDFAEQNFIPNQLIRDLLIWCNAKNNFTNISLQKTSILTKEKELSAFDNKLTDLFSLNNLHITKIPLEIYKSKYAAEKINNQMVTLVGDAYFGVPYFKALNVGLKSANYLASNISNVIEGKMKLKSAIKNYRQKVNLLTFWERIVATFKNIAVNIAKFFLYFVSHSPLQFFKWSSENRKTFNDISFINEISNYQEPSIQKGKQVSAQNQRVTAWRKSISNVCNRLANGFKSMV